ncbi:hypothetical protein M0811_11186 [Anaeramoeba ignava]|uniref:Uncharacterized protein n=1 Tax=Anaeramoeba ignava TaxID=1746090 RepID=A0A9Q0LC45_ANAIG|nr:hypothetical protein M0811_11186 [Anaeramoeba ignava]
MKKKIFLLMKIKFFILLFCFSFFILIVQNQTLKNSFIFPTSISNPTLSLIDENNGFLYYFNYDDSVPSVYFNTIFQIDFNSFKFLNSSYLSDLDQKFQQDFSIIDSIELPESYFEIEFVSSHIDLNNSKAYFILNCNGIFSSDNDQIFKIDLTNFSIELNTSIDADSIYGSQIDLFNQYLYIFSSNPYPQIQKIDLGNLSEIGTLTLIEIFSEWSNMYGIIDNSTNLMYVGFSYYPSLIIVKVNLTDFTKMDNITVEDKDYNDIISVGIDTVNHLGYFVVGVLSYSYTWISKINLTSFESIQSYSFSNYGAVISFDSSTTYAYIGFTNSSFIKFDLLEFQEKNSGLGNFQDPFVILIDELNQMAYVGFDYLFGLVAKIDLSSFQLIDYITNDNSSDKINYGEIDSSNGFAYFFINSQTKISKIMKVELSNFSISEMKILDSNGSIQSTCFDNQNHFLYVGFSNLTDENGKIFKISFWLDLIKIDLDSFNQTSYLDLTNYYPIQTMLFNSIHQYIYFLWESENDGIQICGIELSEMRVLDDYVKIESDQFFSFLSSVHLLIQNPDMDISYFNKVNKVNK